MTLLKTTFELKTTLGRLARGFSQGKSRTPKI